MTEVDKIGQNGQWTAETAEIRLLAHCEQRMVFSARKEMMTF
jgi:hypothetical protein